MRSVREDWLLSPKPALYCIAIDASLKLDPTGSDAWKICEDGVKMGIHIPLQSRLSVVEAMLTVRTEEYLQNKVSNTSDFSLPQPIFDALLPPLEVVTSHGFRRALCKSWQKKLTITKTPESESISKSWSVEVTNASLDAGLRNYACLRMLPEAFFKISGDDVDCKLRNHVGRFMPSERQETTTLKCAAG